DLYQKVRRARTVTVQAYNLEGQPLEITCSDLPSRVLQHEIDHLHGVLFIDKMGTIARMSSRGALRALEAEYQKAQERGEIPPDDEIARMLGALEEEADRRGAGPPAASDPTGGPAPPPLM